MSTEHGPSYWDVSEYMEHLRAKYGVGVSFRLHPPHRAGPDAKWTSWGVEAEVFHGTSPAKAVRPRVEYFGKGGAWKTAPAALHAALRVLEDRLAEKEEAAARSARF
jgi:glutathione S-transferase